MKNSIKYIAILFLIVFIGFVSWYSGVKYSFIKSHSEVNQEVIFKQVKNVLKLGTVEGYFSEIYDFKEHYGFDISPFQKKALIRIKAKVLVGFNIDSISVVIEELDKKVIISSIPFPKLLSIDHDLDYYDITEGAFNSFTNKDYNMMNSQAKLFIKKTALQSDLFAKAQNQLDGHIDLLKSILNTYGWELIVINKSEFRLKN